MQESKKTETIYYIYKVTFQNEKVYIGKSYHPNERLKQHIYESKKDKPKSIFHRAIKKYGFETIKMEIIDETKSEKEIDRLEKYYIKLYKSNIYRYGSKYGYNATDGGEGIGKGTQIVMNIETSKYEVISVDDYYEYDKYIKPMKGLTTIINYDGNTEVITSEEYQNDKTNYKHMNIGFISVIDENFKNIKKFKRITIEEYYKNKDKYNHASSNMMPVLDLTDMEGKRISTEEYYKNKDRYKATNKGLVAVIEKSTNISKLVSKNEFDVNKELYKTASTGMVVVRNILTNKVERITQQMFKDDDNYESPSKNMVSCYNLNTKEYEQHSKSDFNKFEHLKGASYGMKFISNPITKRYKSVRPNELEKFLNDGWVMGRIKF